MRGMSGTTYGDPKSGVTACIFPFPAFELFQKSNSIFSSVFTFYQSSQAKHLNVTIKGEADLAAGVYVSGDYFRGLAVSPFAGRLIIPDVLMCQEFCS
jgi:hypothetical protein